MSLHLLHLEDGRVQLCQVVRVLDLVHAELLKQTLVQVALLEFELADDDLAEEDGHPVEKFLHGLNLAVSSLNLGGQDTRIV